MSDNSHIQWTDATWPVTTGCNEAGPECLHCYARRDSWRLAHNPNPKVATAYQNVTAKASNGRVQWTGTINCLPERLDWPLKWKHPRRIFVANMSDLFHPDVPDEFVDQVFAIMALCPQHTFQVLTKRPERMVSYFTDESTSRVSRIAYQMLLDGKTSDRRQDFATSVDCFWPLSHVWIGTSVGTQKAVPMKLDKVGQPCNKANLLCYIANPTRGLSNFVQIYARAVERIPLLLQIPATVRFLSCEPLLEKINIANFLCKPSKTPSSPAPSRLHHSPNTQTSWVVVGGESGHGARPCNLDWLREIIQQCNTEDVPIFVKQLGSAWAKESGTYHLDSKGGNPEVWPEALRIREFPHEGALHQ